MSGCSGDLDKNLVNDLVKRVSTLEKQQKMDNQDSFTIGRNQERISTLEVRQENVERGMSGVDSEVKAIGNRLKRLDGVIVCQNGFSDKVGDLAVGYSYDETCKNLGVILPEKTVPNQEKKGWFK